MAAVRRPDHASPCVRAALPFDLDNRSGCLRGQAGVERRPRGRTRSTAEPPGRPRRPRRASRAECHVDAGREPAAFDAEARESCTSRCTTARSSVRWTAGAPGIAATLPGPRQPLLAHRPGPHSSCPGRFGPPAHNGPARVLKHSGSAVRRCRTFVAAERQPRSRGRRRGVGAISEPHREGLQMRPFRRRVSDGTRTRDRLDHN
jgi:hypothetical protein